MIDIFKKSFSILFNNLIFIQPLLLLFLIFTAVLSYSLVKLVLFFPVNIIFFITLFMLCVAFFTGWIYINKCGILSYNEKDSKEEIAFKSLQNFKKFFEGVGSGFFNVLFISVFNFLLYFSIIFAASKILTHYIGIPEFLSDMKLILSFTSNDEFIRYFQSVSLHDMKCFLLWFGVINILSVIMNYFAVLMYASYSFDNKNPFMTLINSIKFFFLNIIPSIGIMLYTYLLYILLNVVSSLLVPGSISFAVLTILLTLYFNYCIILIFDYYYEKNKNNGNNGSELVG